MRDKDTCLALYDRVDRILDLLLGDRIKSRCRLIEDEDGRIFQYYPRYRDTLLLTTRELQAAVSDFGIDSLLLLFDEVPDVRFLKSIDHVFFCRIRLCVKEIIPDRAIEKISLLRYDADLVS